MLHVGLQARHRDAAAIAKRTLAGADAAAPLAHLATAPRPAIRLGATLSPWDAAIPAPLLAPRAGHRRRLAESEQTHHRAEQGATERAPGTRRGGEPGQSIKGRSMHNNLDDESQDDRWCVPENVGSATGDARSRRHATGTFAIHKVGVGVRSCVPLRGYST
jgi:hypothetical protein